MKYKTFMMWRLLAILAVVALAVWAAEAGYELVLIPVVILGTLGLYLLSRRVKEVVVDERVHSVAGKASWLAVRFFVALAAVGGAILVLLNREGASPVIYQCGLTLLYAVCALLVFYWLAYIYYSRKFSGKK